MPDTFEEKLLIQEVERLLCTEKVQISIPGTSWESQEKSFSETLEGCCQSMIADAPELNGPKI